ncbi:flagellar hook protein FlgE [Novosphingobium panipatense]|uniref:flagellar hook protein FlgE n=1 Tax=Novosphingobium TaxID=165696 RepID=UPI000CDA6907|nr:flagellar hook protein FlgE [Novosphingobium sp. HII-3]
MSLYSALYAGVSGLNAQSSAMATVADNITNVNTVGYKGTSAQFQSLVTGGSMTSNYSAGGVTATPKALISKQGMLQASSSLTDVGIDGAGFFVVRSSADSSGAIAYTRAGSFTTDSSGYLRNTAGFYLMGWPLDEAGKYVNNGSLTSLQPIRPNALTGAAAATTSVQLRANLDATAAPVASYGAGDMASGKVLPQFARSVEVFDAQGGAHTLTFNFVKTDGNTWHAEITADPNDLASFVDPQNIGKEAAALQAARDAGTPVTLRSGMVEFNGDGSLKTAGSDLFSALDLSWGNGAEAPLIKLDLGSPDGFAGLTQFGSDSALLSSTVDGGMLGTVASVSISDNGIVSAVFDDGTSRPIYQLPLATFQNPDGLTRISGNAYIVSEQSGNVAINEPGLVGGGKISASMLETSNVDLAAEFSNMILFQRAYSASSKIITTVDDMLQEVGNLKR